MEAFAGLNVPNQDLLRLMVDSNGRNLVSDFVPRECLALVSEYLAPLSCISNVLPSSDDNLALSNLMNSHLFLSTETLQGFSLLELLRYVLKLSYQLYIQDKFSKCSLADLGNIIQKMTEISLLVLSKTIFITEIPEPDFRECFMEMDFSMMAFYTYFEMFVRKTLGVQNLTPMQTVYQNCTSFRVFQAQNILHQHAFQYDNDIPTLRSIAWTFDLWRAVQNLGGRNMSLPSEELPQKCRICGWVCKNHKQMCITSCCHHVCYSCMKIILRTGMECTSCRVVVTGWTTLEELHASWQLEGIVAIQQSMDLFPQFAGMNET